MSPQVLSATRGNAPSSMPESLSQSSPSNALLELSQRSKSNALRLAQELAQSLNANKNQETTKISNKENVTLKRSIGKTSSQATQGQQQQQQHFYPIPLPSILSKYDSKSSSQTSSSSSTPTRKRFQQYNDNPLSTSKACTESILNSLTKVASGGSAASTTLRNLESQRRSTDTAAKDVQAALTLRQSSSLATDALGARRYDDAVKAVSEFESVNASERAKIIAGPHALRAHERTRDVLQRTVLERYEAAVHNSDLRELSNLTPLLGLLDMADKGVGLYLKFAQDNLAAVMNKGLEVDEQVEEKQMRQKQEEEAGVRISRAEAKRREDVRKGGGEVTVCTKLAKIYNAAVTFLRHHLPMVAYSLGAADGDAALVQLINAEVEKRAIDVIRHYLVSKQVSKVNARSNAVAGMIEEKYMTGDGLQYDQQDLFDGGKADSGEDKKTILDRMDDCGFKNELGSFVQINANLDELALLLQHTESYERFIRHAVDEVNKARKLRKEQRHEESKRKWMQDLENEGKDATVEEAAKFDEEVKEKERKQRFQDVLPAQTQLNDIVVETGGYYSGLERTFLLASLQRSFQSVSIEDDRTYSPVTILSSNRPPNAAGKDALQTSVVEECLYAAQRSTLRAFATGHNATASAASNFCVDILGRFLLEVLTHRAETGTAMLKPGDGLLAGSGGLGQTTLALMSSAQKGLSKATTKGLMTSDAEAEEKILDRQRIQEGIAKSCANLNDLEVAVDYTRRLEVKLLEELASTFPPGKKETEQLKACIKSLTGVKESFQTASNESIDHLINTIMPRVRSIVNESVGQDNATTAGFMGGTTTPSHAVRMNYHLDNAAYEMAQLSEGYMSRL